jgi:hypothetical protein
MEMKISTLVRYPVVAMAAAAILAGCSAGPSGFGPSQANQQSGLAMGLAPLSADSALAFGNTAHQGAWSAYRGHTKSWMSPEAKTIKKLLYVSGGGSTNAVDVFDYHTGASVGTLTGFNEPWGMCVDAKGDVWITEFAGMSVIEYAHGGTSPLKTLSTGAYSTGCSIDPIHGDLAVGNFFSPSYGATSLEIWSHAKGLPKSYSNQDCTQFFYPGYDNKGNLYVQGFTSSAPYNYNVCELPVGGTALAVVPIDVTFSGPQTVMWDGKYITLSDQLYGNNCCTAVYQAKELASGGLEVVGTTILTDPCNSDTELNQTFIVGKKNTPANTTQGKAIVGGDLDCAGEFDYFAYPSGGDPSRSLVGPYTAPGTAVSIKE